MSDIFLRVDTKPNVEHISILVDTEPIIVHISNVRYRLHNRRTHI